MREYESAELVSLLAAIDDLGCRLDYVVLNTVGNEATSTLHRAAAIKGIQTIDHRLRVWAEAHATSEHPADSAYRLTWDERKLRGQPITFKEFWGADDVHPRQIDNHTWVGMGINGYKSAFFNPPHFLRGRYHEEKLWFDRINAFALGPCPNDCEIFSWSTNWSNYFEAGLEWWGAFYWTVRRQDAARITVIGASTTD